MKYFLIYPAGNKNSVRVIDISSSEYHEKSDFMEVNEKEFHELDEAIKYARDLSNRHNLEYELFVSRYNKDDNETGYIY